MINQRKASGAKRPVRKSPTSFGSNIASISRPPDSEMYQAPPSSQTIVTNSPISTKNMRGPLPLSVKAPGTCDPG